MGTTSGTRKDFNPGIKHQLFKNFRRYKENNSVSKNDNAIKISPVEQQILQGIFIDDKSLKKINKALLNHLQNRTLYNKFDERYMKNNPYEFFQEGLNLYLKDHVTDSDYSYDEGEIYFCLIDGKIYITPDDSYGHYSYTFELNLLDILKNKNDQLRELLLNLFAFVLKTGFVSYYTQSQSFEMARQEFIPDDDGMYENGIYDELDTDELSAYTLEIEKYESGLYRELMNEVEILSEDNHRNKIMKNILELSSEIKHQDIQVLIDQIVEIYRSLKWSDVEFFVKFQSFAFDMLDQNRMKYNERYNHIIEYNHFQYECDGLLEEYYNQFDQNTFNEQWYQPYLIPTLFSDDGTEKDYDLVLKKIIDIFDLIIKIEQHIYARYSENIN